MSEVKENLMLPVPIGLPDALKTKIIVWGNFGLKAADMEVSLSKSVAIDYTVPTTLAELPDAELKLAELKKAQTTTKEIRLGGTAKLTDWLSNQMVWEKSLDEPIKKMTDAIIVLKKEKQAEDSKAAVALQAKADFKKQAIVDFEATKANALKCINDTATNMLLHALDNVPADLPAYIESAKAKISADTFIIHFAPQADAELQTIFDEIWINWNILRASYKSSYDTLVTEKFSDFAIQLQNKEAAKAQATQTNTAAATSITNDANMQTAAATLDVMAETSAVTTYSKALKKSYVIDMDDDIKSFKAVIKAFFSVIDLAFPKIKVKSVFNIKVEQMATALGALKSEDNKLEFEGIKFKEVDKL